MAPTIPTARAGIPITTPTAPIPTCTSAGTGNIPPLWVTNGGGGTFANLWTVDTYAQSGITVSDTKTPGHIYEISSEHHVRNEFQFRHVENWDVYAPQTEEEAGESQEAVSLEITELQEHHHRQLACLSRDPQRAAGGHGGPPVSIPAASISAMCMSMPKAGLATCDANGCGTYLRASKFPAENAIRDLTHHIDVREREFAVLDYPAHAATARAARHGQQSRKAGRRVLFHLRRGGGRARQALLRRQASAAHLWLVARRRPFHRARQSHRSGEPGVRQVRQSAGAVVSGGGRHALQLSSPARLPQN